MYWVFRYEFEAPLRFKVLLQSEAKLCSRNINVNGKLSNIWDRRLSTLSQNKNLLIIQDNRGASDKSTRNTYKLLFWDRVFHESRLFHETSGHTTKCPILRSRLNIYKTKNSNKDHNSCPPGTRSTQCQRISCSVRFTLRVFVKIYFKERVLRWASWSLKWLKKQNVR